jgi:sugar phosphate isomerase/epimerase
MTMSPEISRRHFVRDLTALSVSGSLLAGCSRMSATTAPGGVANGGARAVKPVADGIGVQLYTVSDQLRADFDGAIEKVAQIGYKQVEFAGYFNKSPEQVRALLDRLQIKSPSSHIGMDLLRRDLEGQIQIAQTIGHEYITIPSLGRTETPMNTADAWKRIANECNTMGQTVRSRGLKLAFHSHSAEFVDVGGGKTGMDIFVAETDPALFHFQIDLGWARVANQDPVAWFARYPGRFRMWHVKDILNGRPTAIGNGDVNFKPTFAAWKNSGMEYFFVEHDGAASWPGGSLAAITVAYENLRRLLA